MLATVLTFFTGALAGSGFVIAVYFIFIKLAPPLTKEEIEGDWDENSYQ